MGCYLPCSPTASCKSSPNHPVVFLKRGIVSNRAEFCHWSSSAMLGWPNRHAPMALHCSGLIQGDSSCLGEGRFIYLFTSDHLPWSWRSCPILSSLGQKHIGQYHANGMALWKKKSPTVRARSFQCENKGPKRFGRSTWIRLVILFFYLWGDGRGSEPSWKVNLSHLFTFHSTFFQFVPTLIPPQSLSLIFQLKWNCKASPGGPVVKKIHLPMQETWVWFLIWEEPTCLWASKPLCHNYWACALEPGSCSYWSLHA